MLEERAPQVGFDAIEYWEGCDRGELLVQRCGECGRVVWFPRFLCNHCSSTNLKWEKCTGKGVVESFTVIYRPMNSTYADEVPYVLALIRADEGHLLVSRIIGDDNLETTIGAAVTVAFVKTPGHALPVFTLD